MFDISWSELLILGIVALIVVGPKELPVLLRTLGRYAGMARKQATEFRAHFDEAMREAEMAELREEMEGVRRDILKSAGDAEKSVTAPLEKVERILADRPKSAEAARSAAAARIAEADKASAAGGAGDAASATEAAVGSEPARIADAAAKTPAKEA